MEESAKEATMQKEKQIKDKACSWAILKQVIFKHGFKAVFSSNNN